MKRRLYGDHTDNGQSDEEISLDRIKRNVPLKRVIDRRYREFMELHSRLTGGELGVHMKGRAVHTHHGCHRSGNSQGKKFFKVREMSGNYYFVSGKIGIFKKSQGKLKL